MAEAVGVYIHIFGLFFEPNTLDSDLSICFLMYSSTSLGVADHLPMALFFISFTFNRKNMVGTVVSIPTVHLSNCIGGNYDRGGGTYKQKGEEQLSLL